MCPRLFPADDLVHARRLERRSAIGHDGRRAVAAAYAILPLIHCTSSVTDLRVTGNAARTRRCHPTYPMAALMLRITTPSASAASQAGNHAARPATAARSSTLM